jgi:hypothetical protein
MAFADEFVQCMSQYGVTIDASAVPDADLLRQSLEYAQQWFYSLEQGMQTGFDAASTDERASILLADPSVNAAPAIPDILHAFDSASGQPFSTLLQAAIYCAHNAGQSAGS